MALMAMCKVEYVHSGFRIVVNRQISYDVKNVELLSSGETVVILTDGESVSRRVRMVKEFYRMYCGDDPSNFTAKGELIMTVDEECELHMSTYKIDGNYNLACRWTDYREMDSGVWIHDDEKGTVNQNLCLLTKWSRQVCCLLPLFRSRKTSRSFRSWHQFIPHGGTG